MVRRDWVHQRFGSMVSTVIDSHEMTDREALIEIATMLSDTDFTSVHAMETHEGYDIVVSTALDEDIVFRIDF